MQRRFSLFRSHIEAAQFFWTSHLLDHKGNILDATLGQGKDTLFLAKAVEGTTQLIFGVDIQQDSIIKTTQLLEQELGKTERNRTVLLHCSHTDLDYTPMQPLTLVVYNLGYLPGGDHSITTETLTTQKSITQSLNALGDQGMMTITCYPGHDEGKKETQMLEHCLWNLPKKIWSVTYLQFAQENSLAPTLWIIQKSSSI